MEDEENEKQLSTSQTSDRKEIKSVVIRKIQTVELSERYTVNGFK